MVFNALRRNTKGGERRRRALRRIGDALMRIYADDDSFLKLVEAKREREVRRRRVRYAFRRTIWKIVRDPFIRANMLVRPAPEPWVGAVERWVDEVHRPRGGHTTHVTERVTHAVRCLVQYVRLVERPRNLELARAREGREAQRWKVRQRWARALSHYKNEIQGRMLAERLEMRGGLVCASTRNVRRLAPKGGVTYDETTRRTKARIRDDAMYKTNRWPLRDKCGPTLVGILHHAWGIT